jgi:hypothetical protein
MSVSSPIMPNDNQNAPIMIDNAHTLNTLAENRLANMMCEFVLSDEADLQATLLNIRRVLAHDGKATTRVLLAPTHKKPPQYVRAFLRLGGKPPQHFYNGYEWARLFKHAQFDILSQDILHETHILETWTQGQSDYNKERLHILLIQAPQAVKAHLQPQHVGTHLAQFLLPYATVTLQKI